MNNFFDIIEAALIRKPRNSNLVNDFFSVSSDIRRYVIGKNDESTNLINLLNIDGIIDDFSETEVKWNGIPVFRTEDVPKDALVVNCSTSISPVTVGKKLAESRLRNVINIHEVIAASEGKIKQPWFVDQMRDDYMTHKSQWHDLYNLMADEESKKTLLDVMRFRLTADLVYMMNYNVRLNEQYFEDFLRIDQEIFVDAGGFDGATTEEFCRRYPDYRKVFLFEPSAKNIQIARDRLKGLRSVEFIEQGLSDAVGTLAFNPDAGSASAVSESGSCQIHVTTLDIQVQEKVSFIKMDLEGWELKALEGSRRHILEDHPKLAIAVYHHPSDFWRAFEFVRDLRPDYRVYLRHYTEGWSETVMFFTPNQ